MQQDAGRDGPHSIDDPRTRPGQDQRWLWHQAVQIVGQLPEGERDALAVLWYARQLIKTAPKAKPA